MKNFFQKRSNLFAVAAIVLTLIIAAATQNGANRSKAPASSAQPTNQTQPAPSDNAPALSKAEQTAIRDDALQRAAGYAKNEDYKMAAALLSEALKKVPGDERLSSTLSEYQNANRILVRSRAISAAQDAAEIEDYAAVLTTIKSALGEIGDDAELAAFYANYKDAYRQQLVAAAKSAYESNDYQGAVSTLRGGLSILDGDAELKRLIESYQSAEPVPFVELINLMTYHSVQDVYSTKKELFHDVLLPYTDESCTYKITLNGEYERAYGTLIWDLNKIDYPNYPRPTIRFHGDGKDLLVTSVDCATGQTDFEVDLSGIIYLEVELVNLYTYTFGLVGGVANFNFCKSLAV